MISTSRTSDSQISGSAISSHKNIQYDQVTHNSTIGKALAYSIHQEPYLRTFLTDGDVPMDNNFAEQAIRPFTIGHKNFVLIESSNGARASAMLYSLVETAKANNLRVYEYLEYVLTEQAKHQDDTDRAFLTDLLPWSEAAQQKCHILKEINETVKERIYRNRQ